MVYTLYLMADINWDYSTFKCPIAMSLVILILDGADLEAG